MIHGYHLIFGTYGFWLPNDPRGSWSEFVAAFDLRPFGAATKGMERLKLTPEQEIQRVEAKKKLHYPEVVFNGPQARAVGHGFAKAIEKSNLTIWACSVLPQHVHLVVARHTFKVEYIAGLLKGEATKALKAESLHPLSQCLNKDNQVPSPWNVKSFKVYLDSESAIEEAIHYVNENPVKEDKPAQSWSFVTPFAGLDNGWVTYH